MEIDISNDIVAKDKEGKTLNKPFRLPSGSKKKFGVYVKNDKGNVVMVKFGDPNMEIKRDDPARRKITELDTTATIPARNGKLIIGVAKCGAVNLLAR